MKKYNVLTNPIRKLLLFSPLQYMFDTIMEDPSLASIYADNENDATGCVVLFGNYLWVAGSVLKEDIVAIMKESQKKEIIVYYDTQENAKLFKDNFAQVYDNIKSLYIKKVESGLPNYSTSRISPIDSELLHSDTDNLDMIIDEVIGTGTYKSMDDFCATGIGFSYVLDNKVFAFCTSEYQSEHNIAIGIEVLEEQQKKGIAKEMTTAFLHNAFKRNLNVYWDCWKKNEGSVKTAITCEFNKVCDYPLLYIDQN